MVKKAVFFFAFTLFAAAVFTACGKVGANNKFRIGHSGGNLLAALYAVQDSIGAWAVSSPFQSTSDIAYALILGRLDAGFVEAEKLAALTAMDGFDKLTVVGKITYPYGATLVLRKGLNVRLNELDGLTVASSEEQCVLRAKFIEDARRLGADISGIRDKYMTFSAMLPALESGTVDAAVIKGSYAVAAVYAGHSILYQNWEVEPGDECCPKIIAQAALVLLARRDKAEGAKKLVDALIVAQKLPQDNLRRAVAKYSVIEYEMLAGQPVPEFSSADDELVKIFVEAEEEHSGENEDDDAHNHDAHNSQENGKEGG
jgi:ABC-type nitrate/sulfonate/bicarbonate transport system substrate-binding protein